MSRLHPIRDSDALEERHIFKQAVWNRDGRKCFYCDRKLKYKYATIDHIKPECFGGKMEWGNVVIACFQCNHTRGNMPADIFLTLMMTGGIEKTPANRDPNRSIAGV